MQEKMDYEALLEVSYDSKFNYKILFDFIFSFIFHIFTLSIIMFIIEFLGQKAFNENGDVINNILVIPGSLLSMLFIWYMFNFVYYSFSIILSFIINFIKCKKLPLLTLKYNQIKIFQNIIKDFQIGEIEIRKGRSIGHFYTKKKYYGVKNFLGYIIPDKTRTSTFDDYFDEGNKRNICFKPDLKGLTLLNLIHFYYNHYNFFFLLDIKFLNNLVKKIHFRKVEKENFKEVSYKNSKQALQVLEENIAQFSKESKDWVDNIIKENEK